MSDSQSSYPKAKEPLEIAERILLEIRSGLQPGEFFLDAGFAGLYQAVCQIIKHLRIHGSPTTARKEK